MSSNSIAGAAPDRPEGFRRVSAALAALGHAQSPVWLDVAARTSQQAADALGVVVGQIAKSVVFRRLADDAAVIVVAAGDRRVDEDKVAAITGAVGRADAGFVKASTGFVIGGVAPLAYVPNPVTTPVTTHATPHAAKPVMVVDSALFRFDVIWAAAGHPHGVFCLTPQQLVSITGAPVHDVAVAP
jgi:prolyl-tRNA editing enzyme YbaK/EbsC (Cys-tRNA(Pro) deacylase)